MVAKPHTSVSRFRPRCALALASFSIAGSCTVTAAGTESVSTASPPTEASTTAAPAPAPNPELLRQRDALVADVRRLVAAQQSLGWVVDRFELDDMYPSLLRSLCPVEPGARLLALEVFRAESERAGDPKALFATAHEMTSEVKVALTAERSRLAVEKGIANAARDCPFWLGVDPEFEGIQTDRNRFTINVESGGVAILRETAGRWTLGAGGFGRILPAYGFGGSWTLLGGGEFGGGALIRQGDETTGLAVNYFCAAPVIARLRQISWHYDVELAPVALFQTDDTRVSYGVRVGTTAGISALYTTGFIPWAGASLAYEYYLESGGRPVAHFIRFGLRAGLSWDP